MRKTIILTLALTIFQKAEECYVCLEKCDDPLKSEKCRHEGMSESVQIKCFTIEINTGGMTSVEKGCLPEQVADTECSKANNIPGTTCSTCSTDLCNGRQVQDQPAGAKENILFLGLMGLWLLPHFIQ